MKTQEYQEQITIKVTQDHIDRGKPLERDNWELNACPIALAIDEQTGFVGEAGGKVVFLFTSEEQRLSGKGCEYTYTVPEYVEEFIDKFQDGLKVEPIEFVMELV